MKDRVSHKSVAYHLVTLFDMSHPSEDVYEFKSKLGEG